MGIGGSNCSINLGDASFYTLIAEVLHSEFVGVAVSWGFMVIYIMLWGVEVLLKTPLITSAFVLFTIICPLSVKATSERGNYFPNWFRRGLI